MKITNTRHLFTGLALIGLVLVTACTTAGMHNTNLPDAASAGAKVYSARCSSCHALPHPQRLGYNAWLKLLPVMEQRMQERGMEKLHKAERDKLLAYLKAHSR